MKKLFWYLYTRIRLWYLYRGAGVPSYDRIEYWNCPVCKWDPTDGDINSKNYLGTSDTSYGYDGAIYWTEHWKCPRCGAVFSVDESN